MSDNSRSLFEQIKDGLEESIQFTQGELNLRTTTVPTRPPAVTARKIVALRQKLGMSQGVFAQVLNVSAKTVQSWEQGERKPSQAALRLLQVMQAQPQVVCQAAGLRKAR
jgi:putative transcriptional regulator